jgi:hypothetical protein
MATESPAFEFLDSPARQGDLGRVGRYRVIDLLGKGGMGQVFLAEDTRLKRRVALKVMNQKFASTPHSRKRFIEEARSMAAVHHDNVATIFEVSERGGMPYMAMELLRGQTLMDANAGQPIRKAADVIRIASEVTRGLAAAHAVGISHRDIKPANLWIEDPTGRVKILDFGLALARTGNDRLSLGGTVIGTPGYLAPEQARNEPVDDRTDLYSLGVVLYELCTGRLPLLSNSIPGQLIAIIVQEPKPIRELNPEVPEPLADLIHQLLAKEPRHRPNSAAGLANRLEEVRARCAAENNWAVEIVTEPAPRTKIAESVTPPSARAKRAPVWALSMGTVLSVVGIAIVGLLSSSSDGVPNELRPQVSARHSESPKVFAASLEPLELARVVSGSSRVAKGEAARFRVSLSNHAPDPDQDPRRINADASVAGRVMTFLKRPGQLKRRAPAFPKQLSPTQLPAPGETTEVEIQFLTENLALEPVQVIFELQSPAGAAVSSVSADLTVMENLRRGELLGFETLRTHSGRGADTFVRSGAEQAFGDKPFVQVHEQGGQVREHAYLRFDLGKSPVPRDEIDRAVLLLTVDEGGFPGTSTITAYGVPPGGEGPWKESGSSPLTWNGCPSSERLSSLSFLGQAEVDNRGSALKHSPDAVRVVGTNLDDYVRGCTDGLATIVLVREARHAKPTRFVSKEGNPTQSPALALRRRNAAGQGRGASLQ